MGGKVRNWFIVINIRNTQVDPAIQGKLPQGKLPTGKFDNKENAWKNIVLRRKLWFFLHLPGVVSSEYICKPTQPALIGNSISRLYC